MRSRVFLFAALSLLLCASGAFAQNSLSTSGLTGAAVSTPEGGSCGDVVMNHSTSNDIAPGNSVSCNSSMAPPFGHADNFYYRAYNPADFGVMGDFAVCEVVVGVESATGGADTTQPITVNIYSGTGFPAGFVPGTGGMGFTAIGTMGVTINDADGLTLVTVPITGTVPMGEELIIEVFTPDGQADGTFFFMGSNALGQADDSFLAADTCGISAPDTTASIGFPQMQIVLFASGDEQVDTGLPETIYDPAIPTLDWVGLLALVSLLGVAGFFLLRRR
ncbi:MAG: hypothetical protein AAGN46_02320 [Acidobacteriota bacterium]